MNTHWKIDRKISISAMLAIFVQLVTLIAWASYLEARVSNNETAISRVGDISEKLARIEERVNAVRDEVMLLRNLLKKTGET